MADKPSNPLLKRPLYVYDLPPELLQTLKLRDGGGGDGGGGGGGGGGHPDVPLSDPPAEGSPRPSAHHREDVIAQSTSCQMCGTTYSTVQDQRQHVKSDFHRYNLKLRLKQIPPVDEATFTRMIGDLDESISGSESSEDDEDGDNNDDDVMLSALLKKQAKILSSHSSHQADTETPRQGQKRLLPQSTAPMFWFTSSTLKDADKVLGIYKAIFPKQQEEESPSSSLVDLLKKSQVTPTYAKNHGGKAAAAAASIASAKDRHYFLCMIGGGHFAAMIVSLVPQIQKGPGGVEERQAVVLAHKTFHRYTTRRKQGGSQSANDNAKGNAHSVGSSIRRANEAALELDVRNVLAEWKTMIDSAELLFVRATGSQNRRILFGPYDHQVLNSRDPRLRGFPFSTRRATQAELLWSFQELMRVKVANLVQVTAPEPAGVNHDSSKAEKSTPAAAAAAAAAAAPKLTKDEEAAKLHTSQLQNLIRRSKAPGILLYLEKNSLSPNFQFYPLSSSTPTPLHLASAMNSAAVVSALLLKAHADPTLKNSDGKTAYELATDSKTRDAFRVARHELERGGREGKQPYDWNAANVPSGVSQEEASARQQQEKAEAASLEAQRRQADLDKLRRQEEQQKVNRIERKAGAGKTIQPIQTAVTGAEKREQDTRGLTPEQRMKLERERRARAAEERFRRMQQG